MTFVVFIFNLMLTFIRKAPFFWNNLRMCCYVLLLLLIYIDQQTVDQRTINMYFSLNKLCEPISLPYRSSLSNIEHVSHSINTMVRIMIYQYKVCRPFEQKHVYRQWRSRTLIPSLKFYHKYYYFLFKLCHPLSFLYGRNLY